MKKTATDFHGKLLGMSEGLLHGWLYNAKQFDERAIVEIYADDYPINLVRAETWIPELAEQNIGDGCYGFFAYIPLEKLAQVRRIRARAGNSNYWLEGTIYPAVDTAALQTFTLGYVANHSGLRVQGWAWNPASPNQAVSLRFYEGNELLGEVVANQIAIDLPEHGTGKHGFNFNLPLDLADGCVHEVRVVDDKSRPISGSPLIITTFPEGFDSEINSLSFPDSEKRFLKSLVQHYQHYVPESLDFALYPHWFERFGKPESMPGSSADFLVVVFGEGNTEYTVRSLLSQTDQNLHILIKGDYQHDDPRVESVPNEYWHNVLPEQLTQHQGLLSFVEAGDSLEPGALALIGAAFINPSVLVAYSDCDSQQQGNIKPWFKPDWDFDLFLAQNLLQHLFAIRSNLLPIDSPWLVEPDAWPWLAIAVIGDNADAISHIPYVLYHRSEQCALVEKDEAIVALLPKIAPGVQVSKIASYLSARHIQWPEPTVWPKVSLIVPTRDQQELLERCIASLQKTDYPNLEIIIVDNDSQHVVTHRYLKKLARQGIRILSYPHRFNYSAINNMAVAKAQGDLIGLINNDVEAINTHWLKMMVIQLLRPNVGAVGAKLLWPNGMVQHGGVLLGMHGLASVVGHIGNNWAEHDPGYFGYNQIIRRMSAVTAACLLCHKSDYQLLGGFDEQAFPVVFNDVDFCLRLRAQGKHIVWTPDAKLWHKESASRSQDDTPEKQARLEREKHELKKRWGDMLFTDPFYNPNLNLDHYSYNGLAFPPRQTD